MSNKNALSLIAQYGGDSSEDEVPYGRVSTKRILKESDDEQEVDRDPKRVFNKLPLPSILKISSDNDMEIENPLEHEGRIRSFPHERGNWATYAYIPCLLGEEIESLIIQICNGAKNIDLKPISDYHISLTRTVILRHHWIESFVQSVREKVSFVKSFVVMYDSLKIYCNEERTRTFIGLQIKSGYDTLLKLVTIFNSCLNEFNLPEFYKDPSFHISILWCLGDREEELNRHIQQFSQDISVFIDLQESYFIVNKIQCKSGNKVFSFELT